MFSGNIENITGRDFKNRKKFLNKLKNNRLFLKGGYFFGVSIFF
jgi:hypothetical protein